MNQDSLTIPAKYPLPMRILHWLLAITLLGLVAVGLIMTGLPKDAPYRMEMYSLHKSFGVTVLVLAALRLFYRVKSVLPPPPASIPARDYRLANIVHRSLYVLMFAIPLAGYMMSNSFGRGVSWFGVALPNLVGPNEEIGGWAAFLHEWLAYGLLALVALHVAGVIKHFVAEKQNLVKRMW